MQAGLTRVALLFVVASFTWRGALADHGRFLPDPPPGWTFGNTGPGNNPSVLDRPVVDSQKRIVAGQIRFDYDTYIAMMDFGRPSSGGAGLSGGFFLNDGVELKPGFSLGWVQTVTATITGGEAGNSWNLAAMNAGEYPDADPMDRPAPGLDPTDTLLAPTYPFNFPSVFPLGMEPDFGFQDYPSRNTDDGNQSWLAELGLTCISNEATINMGGMMFREVRVIDTLLWGFNLNGLPVAGGGNPGIGNVGSDAPGSWSDPTMSYLDTLNGFYDGMGGGPPPVASAKYKFFNNDNCFQRSPTATDPDFDDDGDFDLDDVDSLVFAIVEMSNDFVFDLTSDGLVDQADLQEWLYQAGILNINAPYLPGDANLDGFVDGKDFIIWNTNKFTEATGWSIGDFDPDGDVDGRDFIVWNENKFRSSGGTGLSVVPEPTGTLVLLLGLACILVHQPSQFTNARKLNQ